MDKGGEVWGVVIHRGDSVVKGHKGGAVWGILGTGEDRTGGQSGETEWEEI